MTLLFALLMLLAFSITGLLLMPLLRHPSLPPKVKRQACLALGLFMLIGSILLYTQLGSPRIVPALAERQRMLDELHSQMTTLEVTTSLQPDNLTAWAQLGDTYRKLGRYADSAEALKHAVRLSQGNPTLILEYAKSQLLAAGGMTPEAKRSLEMVLMLEPENAEAKALMKMQ